MRRVAGPDYGIILVDFSQTLLMLHTMFGM